MCNCKVAAYRMVVVDERIQANDLFNLISLVSHVRVHF